ncbi:DUF397 domain-containing protein [Streptomyces sp. NPDC057509]|uniref:DUF397 domain-containing protein n=1 Tax=Streptomyces sp. NPDC057509 TaxID=3346152 RepID=UPI003681BBA8
MSSTHAPQPLRWAKSTYSGGEGGQCIEWAPDHAAATGEYLVRDSKTPHAAHLTLTATAFTSLVEYAKHNA